MEERILKFVAALRAGGVRVSMAESVDAFQAVEQVGVQEREMFRLSLRATLVKDARGGPVFDELFPLFFDRGAAPPMMDITEDLTDDEAEMLAQALSLFNQQLREMMERLLRGEQLSAEELRQLGQLVGLNRLDDLRYRDWMAQRMLRALRHEKVRDALAETLRMLEQMGMTKERIAQMQALIKANLAALEQQVQDYAGQRIADSMGERPPAPIDMDALLNRPFGALSERDMEILRKEVRRLAARLRSRIALRQKRAKGGQLDAKATIRANLKHGGVPVEIRHRDKRLKPKLVVICDISTSMRHCSELMLSLVYQLQDLVAKTHAFAFIDHLEYITPDFMGRDADEAIDRVLVRMPPGYYSTDLGYSLENFAAGHMDAIDGRTTLIMVGDGRNNHADPQLDIFRRLARRSRRSIWINPEPPLLWGTGDSDMLRYAPLCDDVVVAATLSELAAAVDHLLTTP